GRGRAGTAAPLSLGANISPKPQEASRCNRRGRTVHRFPGFKWIGGPGEVIAETVQVRRAAVPHRNAVGARLAEIEVGGGFGGAQERGEDLIAVGPLTPTFAGASAGRPALSTWGGEGELLVS